MVQNNDGQLAYHCIAEVLAHGPKKLQLLCEPLLRKSLLVGYLRNIEVISIEGLAVA